MSNTHPNELFKQLYDNASTRKKKTLTLIHETCQQQHASNDKDFSLSTISKLITPKGGLSEQALRNKNAEEYRLLIKQWAEYSNTTTKKPKKQGNTTLYDEILSQLPDPTIKALVGMIIAENRKLKNENNILKNQTCITIDMRNESAYSGANQNVIVLSPLDELTDTEIEALKDAISDETFREHGWTTDELGRVKEKDYPIYKPGYVTAIKKLLNLI